MNKIRQIKKFSVLQHDSTDCGAACLVSVIKYLGGNCNIEKVRKESGTSQYGTTLLGLYQAALKEGLQAEGYEATVNDITSYDGTLILHITQADGSSHYIVCYGFENNRFIIWNPAKGLEYYSPADLEKIWHSRKCVGLVKGKNFRHEKENRKEKRNWIISSLNPDKEILIVSVFIGVVISVLGLAMAIFTRKLIDEILPSGNIKILILTSFLVFSLLSAKIIITGIRQYFLLLQGKEFNIRVVSSFYSSLLFLPKSFFDSRKTGDFVARLNDTMRIQKVISDTASIYVIDLLILILTLAMIFYYSKTAALITVLAIPVLFFVVLRRNKKIINLQYEAMVGYSMNESNYISSLKGITEIKSLNWQKTFIERNNLVFSDFQERALRLGKMKTNLGVLINLAGTFYLIGILFYLSLAVMRSGMTAGELMAVLTLCSSLIPSVMNLALLPVPFNEAKVAIARMFEFTQIEPESQNGRDDEVNLNIDKMTLKNISFRFPGQKLLLKEINISLEKGKIVTLVGESGCGKSTFINIIMKFLEAEEGEIIINDSVESSDVSLKNWRSSIGLVPQEIHIFNCSILENILNEVTEENMNRLAVLISENNLTHFFDRFPAGLLTNIGEEGVKLSGGQRQIIAFLRALIQKPDILLIDEGTSNLDRESELMIMNLLSKIKKETGILLITHRINLIRQICDYIYVLNDGVITETGTHQELIGYENLYKKFWEDFA